MPGSMETSQVISDVQVKIFLPTKPHMHKMLSLGNLIPSIISHGKLYRTGGAIYIKLAGNYGVIVKTRLP